MKTVARPSDPLITTREVDVFFAFGWLGFTFWAVSSSVIGLRTIIDPLGVAFNTTWGILIGVLAALASSLAFSLFIEVPRVSNLSKKKYELAVASALLYLFAIYPMNLVFRSLSGDLVALPNIGLALVCLLVIYYRMRTLKHRIASYVPLV